MLYRPAKQRITLRLNADVVTWFKREARNGRGYEKDINRALREHARQCGKQENSAQRVPLQGQRAP